MSYFVSSPRTNITMFICQSYVGGSTPNMYLWNCICALLPAHSYTQNVCVSTQQKTRKYHNSHRQAHLIKQCSNCFLPTECIITTILSEVQWRNRYGICPSVCRAHGFHWVRCQVSNSDSSVIKLQFSCIMLWGIQVPILVHIKPIGFEFCPAPAHNYA